MSRTFFKKISFFKDKLGKNIFSASFKYVKAFFNRVRSSDVEMAVKNLKRGSKLRRPVRNLGWMLKPASTMEKYLPNVRSILKATNKGRLFRSAALDVKNNLVLRRASTGADAGRFISSKLLFAAKSGASLNTSYARSVSNRNLSKMIKHIWRNSINHWRY